MRKFKINVMAIAAIVIATSTLAFKAAEEKQDDLVWFQITENHAPGVEVPSADAVYLNHGLAPMSTTSCSGAAYQCISGFNTNQVDETINKLDGDQEPADDTRTRN